LATKKEITGVSDDPPKPLSSRFQTLSQAAANGTAPGNAHINPERLPAPATPRGRKTAFPSNRAEQAVQNVLLAPLPEKRKLHAIGLAKNSAINPSLATI